MTPQSHATVGAIRQVEFGRSWGMGALAVAALATAVVVSAVAAVLNVDRHAPYWSVGIGIAPILVIAAIIVSVRLMGPGRAVVDLTTRTLRTRRQTVAFRDIHRMVMFSVFQGGDWLVLADASGRQIARFGVNWSVRPSMGAAQWRAMHELLWYSSVPGLERSPYFKPGPARSPDGVDRATALTLIAAQVAWLERGGAAGATRAPLFRFVRGL